LPIFKVVVASWPPVSNYNGQVSLTYDVIDGQGGSLAATQSFALLAVDDLSVLGSTDVIVEETNVPLIVNGVLSISDIDSLASFVAQPATGGKHGVFVLGTDGSWSYKAKLAYDYLDVGHSLQDTFQVTSSDGSTSSVSVTITGTADTTTVHLGDAPVRQSGTGGQWAQAWSQTGYSLLHKADHTNGAVAWSAVKLSGVSSQLLTGGDIYAGDLGVSGQSAATSTVKQEIDGKEALRVTLPSAADSVTLKLARLFTNDDVSAFSESGLLRLLDSSGNVVAEQAFFADSASGTTTVTLSAKGGFTSLELIAGACDSTGSFVYGGYSTAGGDYGGAISADSAGKLHGSDFLVDSMDFAVTLVGPASARLSRRGEFTPIARRIDRAAQHEATPQKQQAVAGLLPFSIQGVVTCNADIDVLRDLVGV
jgi:VCBS repeat-containing protein